MDYFLIIAGMFVVGGGGYLAGYLRAWGLWDDVAGKKLTDEERAFMDGEL